MTKARRHDTSRRGGACQPHTTFHAEQHMLCRSAIVVASLHAGRPICLHLDPSDYRLRAEPPCPRQFMRLNHKGVCGPEVKMRVDIRWNLQCLQRRHRHRRVVVIHRRLYNVSRAAPLRSSSAISNNCAGSVIRPWWIGAYSLVVHDLIRSAKLIPLSYASFLSWSSAHVRPNSFPKRKHS